MNAKEHIFRVLLILLSLGFFVSCDDDEADSSDLIGTWRMVHAVGYDKENGKTIDEWDITDEDELLDDYYIYVRFDEDKEMYEGDQLNRMYYVGDWSLKGNKLTLSEYDSYYDEYDEVSVNVKKLTSNELVLEDSGSFSEDGVRYEYKETVTYTKVK